MYEQGSALAVPPEQGSALFVRGVVIWYNDFINITEFFDLVCFIKRINSTDIKIMIIQKMDFIKWNSYLTPKSIMKV